MNWLELFKILGTLLLFIILLIFLYNGIIYLTKKKVKDGDEFLFKDLPSDIPIAIPGMIEPLYSNSTIAKQLFKENNKLKIYEIIDPTTNKKIIIAMVLDLDNPNIETKIVYNLPGVRSPSSLKEETKIVYTSGLPPSDEEERKVNATANITASASANTNISAGVNSNITADVNSNTNTDVNSNTNISVNNPFKYKYKANNNPINTNIRLTTTTL